MGLAPLQRQRFVFLLGNRYTGSDKIKLVCKQYNTFHENKVRVLEILREIYWESKRAPEINTTSIKNPYRREFLRKKFMGRTREERFATLERLKVFEAKNKIEVDAAIMGLTQEKETEKESGRKIRRENATKRAQLGFNDKGKEEIQDTVLEDLDYKTKEYQKQVEEQKDLTVGQRKPVKLVSEVNGIGRAEIERLMLRDSEKFKPI